MRAEWSARAANRATGSAAADVVQLGAPPVPAAGTGRWGLVLGGGGVLGAAWLIGALGALERHLGLDARDADLILGTSAGSVVGALLAGGTSVAEQRERQLAERSATEALDGFDANRPLAADPAPRPRLRPGSPALLRNSLSRSARRRLGSMPATAVLTGLAPQGTARMPAVARLVEACVPAGEWPGHGGCGSSPWTTPPAGGSSSAHPTRRGPGCPRRCWPPAPSPAGSRPSRSAAGSTWTVAPGPRRTPTSRWAPGWTGWSCSPRWPRPPTTCRRTGRSAPSGGSGSRSRGAAWRRPGRCTRPGRR